MILKRPRQVHLRRILRTGSSLFVSLRWRPYNWPGKGEYHSQTLQRREDHYHVPPRTIDDQQGSWDDMACAYTNVLGRRPIDRRLNPLDHISLLNSNNERFWEDAAPQERIARDPTTLNAKQRLVLDLYVEHYQQILAGNNPDPLHINIDGEAGCGKSYLIDVLCSELTRMALPFWYSYPLTYNSILGLFGYSVNKSRKIINFRYY
jgi:hypothetical protein